MKKLFNISAILKSDKGATLVYVALLLVIFLGIAAFAIDIGYHTIVRNQLQNAADAAAIAACNTLYDRTGGPVKFPAPPPDWAAASAEAATAITINKADNKPLSTGAIATGWWDITQPSLGLRANTITPAANDGPAVRVTITKSAGQNAGPIVNFFGQILGVSTADSGATATAVAASPGSVRPGSVLPIAIYKLVADQWGTYNSPLKTIKIGSDYHYPPSVAGQWTSFKDVDNSASNLKKLVVTGNLTELSIGEKIYIAPGTKASPYKEIPVPSDIVLPVIDDIDPKTMQPIVGFIGFHITDSNQGKKYIEGYFTTAPSYGGPIGSHYGPLDLCRLCQ